MDRSALADDHGFRAPRQGATVVAARFRAEVARSCCRSAAEARAAACSARKSAPPRRIPLGLVREIPAYDGKAVKINPPPARSRFAFLSRRAHLDENDPPASAVHNSAGPLPPFAAAGTDRAAHE